MANFTKGYFQKSKSRLSYFRRSMSFPSKLFSMVISAVAFFSVAVCVSCDEDTATIGTGVMPSGDGMTVNSDTFDVASRSLVVDSVLATTNDCRLLRIVDP